MSNSEIALQINDVQRKTFEALLSHIDNLRLGIDGVDGSVFFDGDGPGGPSFGYIEADGTITWITGEVSTGSSS